MPLSVLIVDDSVLVREAVKEILERNISQVRICGEASNGREALDKLESCKPELIILDVEMPVMDGLTFLTELKKRHVSLPVLVLSALTQHGAHTTLKALELGAMEFVPKPAPKTGLKLKDVEALLIAKVQGILQLKRNVTFIPKEYGSASVITLDDVFKGSPRPLARTRELSDTGSTHREQPFSKLHRVSFETGHTPFPPSFNPDTAPKRDHIHHSKGNIELIFIGASTGGPQALTELISALPETLPVPVVIVQHMPPVFTAAFAQRLDQKSSLRVHEASEGMELEAGNVYIAPGNRHMILEKRGKKGLIHLNDEPPVFAHRPSVDKTAESVAKGWGGHVMGIIMTGMGWDGAYGMRMLYDKGAITIAQDESSSVVYGMNRRAVEAGAIHKICPIKNMVEVVMSFF